MSALLTLIRRLKASGLFCTLVIGFGLMLLTLVFFWYGSQSSMTQLYQTVEHSRVASEKMELIAGLIEIARTRTRLTNEMIHTDDPFIKDEIGLQLDIYATRYAKKRLELIAIGLSPLEEDILQQQSEIIRPTLALQRQAAEMAMSDDQEMVKEAQRILIKEVYTGQGKVIDLFMQMLRLQKDIIHTATENAEARYNTASDVNLWLLLVLLAIGMVIIAFVVSRTARIEKALFLEKERAQITLKSIGDAVITTDENGLVEYLNPVAEKITGYLTSEVKGQPINRVFRAYDETNQRWLADCIMRFLNTGSYKLPSNDIILHTVDEDKLDIALTIAPIQNAENKVMGTIATFQDITKTKNMARHIEHQARHDPLTGLLNRNEFERKVNQALTLYAEETTHALCVLDLDRFKMVNDTVGHTAGDELLRQIAGRIRQVLRSSDLFARIGGDEFAIFLMNTSHENAVILADSILRTVREYQFLWNKKSFRIGVSIGLVDAAPNVSDYEYLYHAADTACYMAKHEGRDCVHVVSLEDEDLTATREQTAWATRIDEAIQQDMFVLYGQDIYSLQDRAEAPHKEILLRLIDQDGRIVPPMAFIPAAERYNLMPRIDEWVVNRTIDIIRNSNDKTIYSVNLSGQSMGDKKFIAKIMNILENTPIDTHRLCFEITETAAIANLDNARTFLERLQNLGCQTSLDDFGSGLSSFAYLRNLPIDYLKIDGMFIKQIANDPTSRVMVEAIHSVGRTMKIKTIAEYVEDSTITGILNDIGIDYAQGYHFGKPEPLEQRENHKQAV